MLRIALLAAHADEAVALAQAIHASKFGRSTLGETWFADSHPPLMDEMRQAATPAGQIADVARQHAATYQLTLLCGLETASHGYPGDAEAEALHARLRSALHTA